MNWLIIRFSHFSARFARFNFLARPPLLAALRAACRAGSLPACLLVLQSALPEAQRRKPREWSREEGERESSRKEGEMLNRPEDSQDLAE